MEGSEELSVLAEVLATLAGFTSMIVAIRGRGNPHPWDSYRAVVVLVGCLGGLIVALSPFAIHAFDVTGPALWRLSSAVAFLVTIAPFLPLYLYRPDNYRASRFFALETAVGLANVAVTLSASAFNALAIFTEGAFSLFYLSVIVGVPNIAVQLVIVLVAPPHD